MVEHGAAALTGRPVIVFVLGAARAGTSALARVLSLCGGEPPGGHWEPRTVSTLNGKILRRLGTSVFDPTLRLQEQGALDRNEKAACIEEIRALLTTVPAAPFVVLKDPRITPLSDLWFEAARLAGCDVAAVVAVRHPTEVISAVANRSAALPELSSASWLKVNLLAEAGTRGVPRVFVEYANLLEDWRRETNRISAALGIDLDTRNEDAVEEFLQPNRQHRRSTGPVTDLFGADWVGVVYDALSAAARDEPVDESALDEVFEAYRNSERGFRPVLQGFQRLEKMNRHVGPTVMKMLYEVRAIAIRRHGPRPSHWAQERY